MKTDSASIKITTDSCLSKLKTIPVRAKVIEASVTVILALLSLSFVSFLLQLVLLGAEEGLFAYCPGAGPGRSFVQVTGFFSIHQLAFASALNLVVAVCGEWQTSLG